MRSLIAQADVAHELHHLDIPDTVCRQRLRDPGLSNFNGRCGILVSMTRIEKSPAAKSATPRRRKRSPETGQWLLQDAKARFSELVRRVRSEGPQRVTVHGRDEVVVISAEEFRRLKGDLTGKALIVAMQASPNRDIDIEPRRTPMPVRKVSL